MFNFGEELYIWTHSIYFQILILLKSDGKFSQFDEIWQTRQFWEQTGPAKKKGSKITRTCKTTSTASDFRYSCSCGHHRTNQGLPLHLNIFTLGSSPFNDMVGCMLLQRSVISLQVVTLTNFHLQYGNAYIKPDSIDVLQYVS